MLIFIFIFFPFSPVFSLRKRLLHAPANTLFTTRVFFEVMNRPAAALPKSFVPVISVPVFDGNHSHEKRGAQDEEEEKEEDEDEEEEEEEEVVKKKKKR